MKQLRIATLGDYQNYFSYFLAGSMEGAIRCGAYFRPISLFGSSLNIVREQIDFFKPDILLAHCIFNRTPYNREDVFQLLRDTRKKWNTKICYHMGDARTEPRYNGDISDFVDLGLVNNLELEKWEKFWNIKCIHWPYACLYQREIADLDERFKADIVFTGGLSDGEHHKNRNDFINDLKNKGLNVKIYPDKIYGNSRFLTPEVSASSLAVLGSQMGSHIFGYQDVRPFQYIGAGALYFHDDHGNMDYFFNDKEHYVKYYDANDFIEKVSYYKEHKKEADKIRISGFTFCQKFHNYQTRMKSIIDHFRR